MFWIILIGSAILSFIIVVSVNLYHLRHVDRELFNRGIEVFEDPKKFFRWMESHNHALNGRPLDLVRTPEGKKQVLDVLGRIEHGVHS